MHKGFRRPWDGPDGKDFEYFTKQGQPAPADEIDSIMRGEGEQCCLDRLEKIICVRDFSWGEAEDMSNHECTLYLKYKELKVVGDLSVLSANRKFGNRKGRRSMIRQCIDVLFAKARKLSL